MHPEREATSLPRLGVDIGYISLSRNGADVNRLLQFIPSIGYLSVK